MDNIQMYPLDDRYYSAQDVGMYHCTRTAGVFAAEENLRVSITGDFEVSVSQGMAWLRINDRWGTAFAVNENTALEIEQADGRLDRYDAITISYDRATQEPSLKVKEGEYATDPQFPKPINDDYYVELVIAAVYVPAGATAISTIVDTRLNAEYCGIMRDGVTGIPTQDLFDTWQAAFDEAQNKISNFWQSIQNEGYLQPDVEYEQLTTEDKTVLGAINDAYLANDGHRVLVTNPDYMTEEEQKTHKAVMGWSTSPPDSKDGRTSEFGLYMNRAAQSDVDEKWYRLFKASIGQHGDVSAELDIDELYLKKGFRLHAGDEDVENVLTNVIWASGRINGEPVFKRIIQPFAELDEDYTRFGDIGQGITQVGGRAVQLLSRTKGLALEANDAVVDIKRNITCGGSTWQCTNRNALTIKTGAPNAAVWIRNSNNAWYVVMASAFGVQTSYSSLKENIKQPKSFLDIGKKATVYQYNLRETGEQELGVMIEESPDEILTNTKIPVKFAVEADVLNEKEAEAEKTKRQKQFGTEYEEEQVTVDGKAVNLYNLASLAVGMANELAEKVEQLQSKADKLDKITALLVEKDILTQEEIANL